MAKHKVILVIRDGWGFRSEKKDNAIKEQGAPFTDSLMEKYPTTHINASGRAVGLPEGYQGNSEVGHLTIGSGRIIYQPLMRINESILSGEFFKNSEFLQAIENCKKNGTKLHITGLLQSEGVHAHEDHLFALLDLCKQQDFSDVCLHVITDGRDAPVNDGIKHLTKLIEKINSLNVGKIVTLSGRYYTMDRDNRWDRIKKAYDNMINADGEIMKDDILSTIKSCYENDVTDEFITPMHIESYEGVKDNDSIIFYNFRTDRTRQLTKAIVEKEFEGWERTALNVCYVAMTEFYKPMNALAAFKDQSLNNLLGQVVSKAGLKQLRISETEKYAHVTFFFNGQVEKPNDGEDRILVHSPSVATYDLKPEMSAEEVTEKLVAEIDKIKYDFIVVNIVNGDLVGHTGIVDACWKAVKTVDACTEKIVTKGIEKDYTMLIFADHGNVEDQRPEWRTSHTINPVELVMVTNDEELQKVKLREDGGLVDISPTVLKLLGVDKPDEMTGKSLF